MEPGHVLIASPHIFKFLSFRMDMKINYVQPDYKLPISIIGVPIIKSPIPILCLAEGEPRKKKVLPWHYGIDQGPRL